VPRAAADEKRDLTVLNLGADERGNIPDHPELAVGGEERAFEHLGDDVLGVVDDLLDLAHGDSPGSSIVPARPGR
jgi:hypothetical protein